MSERDYTKFLHPDGRLNIRLIPRPVYLEVLKRYRSDPANIERVFGELYWLWDLNDRERKAQDAGRDASRVELADEIIAEMDDRDWWKIISTFEEELMAEFRNDPARYADLLDPIYDLQEAEGWRDRHASPAGRPG